MTEKLQIFRLKGRAILPFIPDLAKLRIEIFRDYPYLYEGNLTYETNYLNTYVSCAESIMVVVLDQNQLVGASTAIPLKFETNEFKQPFIEHGMQIDDIFYLGESVILPHYRGKNIYRHFFRERELAAKEYGCHVTTFCAVERPDNHPKRPPNYMSLDQVWTYFGYHKHPELRAYLEWQEVGEKNLTQKPLIFWLKNL